MATRTIANGGGNWSDNATWVEGVAPTASDDVVATATSGNLVINSSTLCFCLSADFTNYTGTLSGSGTIRTSGNLTFVPGMTITVTGSIGPVASGTWTFNGKVWTGGILPIGPATITLADDMVCNGAFTHTGTGGAQVFNGNNLFLRCNYTASSGRTIAGTTLFVLSTTTTQTITVSGTFSCNIEINATGNIIIVGLNYNVGTITYVTAGSFTHTGLLTILGTSAYNTAGISWNNVTCGNVNMIVTLNSLLTVAGTLTCNSAIITFAGTAGWTANTWMQTTGDHVLQANNTYTITNSINIDGTNANNATLQSSSATDRAILILQQGATQDVDFCNFRRIDASAGLTIWSYRAVTIDDCVNVKLMPTLPGTIGQGN